MDWNGDGKHDYQDHSFYNNVVSDDAHKSESNVGGRGGAAKPTTYIKGTFTEKEEKTAQIITWIIVGIFLFFKLVIGD